MAKTATQTPVKRGPGRPKKAAAETPVKRGPGRPKKAAAARKKATVGFNEAGGAGVSGISDSRVVRSYLESLAAPARKGRPITESSVRTQIAATEQRLAEENDTLARVRLTQELVELRQKAEELAKASSKAELEAAFIKVALGYSQRHGISHAAWREVGVRASILKAANIRG